MPEFVLEDLPYHVARYYIYGENTPEKPWFMEVDV